MRLLCIDTPKTFAKDVKPEESILRVGEEYNSIGKVKYRYELVEHRGYLYHEQLFIPCSDIDETERIDEVLEEMFVKKETV